MDQRYPLHTRTTDNGIRVAINPDPWVSGVALNLWYEVGSFHEKPGKTGFAHLFEHLMFSGSAQVASGEHLAQIEAMGGHCNATTSFDRTNYFETVPRSGLELALWLEADRLNSLLDSVDQVNLDTQREVVKEEKRQRYDNVPYGDVFPRLMEFAFPPGHRYGHMPIGSMEDLDEATLDDVHSFFHTHYVPSNLIMSLSGAIEPEEGFQLVDKYFSHIPPGAKPEHPATVVVPPLTGIPRLTLSGQVPQDVIYHAWIVPPLVDEISDPVDLGLTVLAGSLSSRLHTSLVRTHLAHSVGIANAGLSQGNSVIYSTAICAEGVTPEELEEKLVVGVETLCTEGPTDGEVARAIRHEDREYLSALAHIETRADHMSGSWSYFDDVEEINRHLDMIHQLTAHDVHHGLKTCINPDHRGTITYRRSL
ncbi:MAG: insulinase family protein [Propionibacteriaceae bacterium]|nr:insulinase family protein [Propionibacteriaceae bacterium]